MEITLNLLRLVLKGIHYREWGGGEKGAAPQPRILKVLRGRSFIKRRHKVAFFCTLKVSLNVPNIQTSFLFNKANELLKYFLHLK